MILFAFVFTYLGLVALSLAMKRHFLQVQPQSKSIFKQLRVVFRLAGAVLLIIAAVLCVASHGVGVGLAYWAGLLTFAALLQALLLAYRPQWVISPTLITKFISRWTNGCN